MLIFAYAALMLILCSCCFAVTFVLMLLCQNVTRHAPAVAAAMLFVILLLLLLKCYSSYFCLLWYPLASFRQSFSNSAGLFYPRRCSPLAVLLLVVPVLRASPRSPRAPRVCIWTRFFDCLLALPCASWRFLACVLSFASLIRCCPCVFGYIFFRDR